MSKITKALEKAALERLRRTHARPTVKAKETVVVRATARPAPTRVAQEAVYSTEVPDHVSIDPHIVGATDPSSPIAEQYRILRSNIHSLQKTTGPKVILVTSAVNGEGKSVTALNLALTMARQENVRVALIDGDMRRSTIHKWLGIPQSQLGLSDILRGGGALNGSLLRLESPNLTIVPAGPVPDAPAELLDSSAMKKLLDSLKNQFDVILIDAPPVLPVADPGILAAHADGVLLVVRSGKTQRKTVQHAYSRLVQTKANVIGCVMTYMDYYLPSYARYYQYYGYDYRPKDQEKN